MSRATGEPRAACGFDRDIHLGECNESDLDCVLNYEGRCSFLTTYSDPPGWTCESWFVDVVERLFRDFEARHSLTTILDEARRCRQQLRGSPASALPELLDRLVRQRLHQH